MTKEEKAAEGVRYEPGICEGCPGGFDQNERIDYIGQFLRDNN